jgi:glycosyltransferase involved in cell wall biosynthesis
VEIPADADHVYAPAGPEQALDDDAAANAQLGLAHGAYDFLLFSRSLAELPRVSAPLDVRQSVVFAREHAGVFLAGTAPRRGLRGRVVRVPGLRDGSPEVELGRLLPGARCAGERGEIEWGPEAPPPLRTFDCSGVDLGGVTRPARPRVFVWPALWAVGGVERNTIEIMRQLRGRYDFVVVTTERLNEQLGSLHHQLKGLAAATYDLAELGPQEGYLSMLAALKRTWAPDLVWICNGSPWQCDHAVELRRLYADTPIVDQQVYDTQAGWINRYHEPGIQSFDRFIAINRRIRQAFVERLRMDPGRIDLIYPAFDASRFQVRRDTPEEMAARRRSAGLPADRPVFLFVGRMSPQKRPLDLVALAHRLRREGAPAFFLMLGDGELAPEVDRAIAGGPPDSVRRMAFTDRVPEILALGDGLVITSEYEGVPVAMLEALATGLPVLSTDVGDVRLLLEEYRAGTVVPRAGDLDLLLEGFHAWNARLPGLREAARSAAPVVARRFSAEALAQQYEESWRLAHRARRGLDLSSPAAAAV